MMNSGNFFKTSYDYVKFTLMLLAFLFCVQYNFFRNGDYFNSWAWNVYFIVVVCLLFVEAFMIKSIVLDKGILEIKYFNFFRSKKCFLISEIELIEVYFARPKEMYSKIRVVNSSKTQVFYYTYFKKKSVVELMETLKLLNVNVEFL